MPRRDGRHDNRLRLFAPALVAAAAVAPALATIPAVEEPRVTALAARPAILSTDHLLIPDDTVLAEQLEDAIELRRREDFDRTLDARDPGELVEHATLTEQEFDYRKVDNETLFIIGDELFGYLFRPENGWGRGGKVERALGSFTARLRRVHRGDSGGPDAFACMSCHFKGGPDGAGTQTQNAMLRGDGRRISRADERNPPHLLGLGPVALLAREMSRDLRALADAAAEEARRDGKRVEKPLATKGVSFGTIAAAADGTLDTSRVEGVGADLVVRPFGWKGHQATLRGIVEESLHIHQGLVSNRVQFAARDGTLTAKHYGEGKWDDIDEDGVSLEIDSGMLTTVVGYLAQLEVPATRLPQDPALMDAFAAGRARFEDIGCTGCHTPSLELADPVFDVREGMDPGRPTFSINVASDGDEPKVEPRYAGSRTSYYVHLFSDLKRHDMGEALASASPQGDIPARHFLTRPLWGLADTAPYLHDGRAPTVHDAIALHGGEAQAARDAYLALPETDRADLRVMLATLSRRPKLFVP